MSARPSGRRRALLALGVVGGLLVLALLVWPRPEAPPPAPRPVEAPPPASPPPPAPDAPAAPPTTSLSGSPPLVSGETLAAALGEERVVVPSRVRIEGVEQDRAWVCAGEVMGLSARVGGPPEPGSVSRWVWPVDSGAELQPGPTLRWRAPPVAGRYPVRFQVCSDLGGRRVGVLAEREFLIDVRACGSDGGPRREPLRIGVEQRGPGRFAFQAVHADDARVRAYRWSFGDGAQADTAEPRAEHTYALTDLAPHEPRSFTVRLQARLAQGDVLEATAFALTRGPPPSTPPPVHLEVSRWRPKEDGEGWWSDVVVHVPEGTQVTWERLERVTLRWDGEADSDTRPWSERIQVDADLGRGGFRGHVTVSAAEAPPEVKQLLDVLHGRDAEGTEVVVSWSPFKREAPPPRPDAPPPPVKE
ncbi:PKD domain-containing protein [Melittangium boletus]|uniref:PKD domain-containing protein n=1 Tax=Melittangium boletus TaxID=83453 RepID=UPI003DA26F02